MPQPARSSQTEIKCQQDLKNPICARIRHAAQVEKLAGELVPAPMRRYDIALSRLATTIHTE